MTPTVVPPEDGNFPVPEEVVRRLSGEFAVVEANPNPEEEAAPNRGGIWGEAGYYGLGPATQPSTANSPRTPHSNFRGASRPTGRSAFGLA